MKLVIGNKNYSSWSLRPWLLLRAHAIAFEEVQESLSQKDIGTRLGAYSGSCKVPVLIDNDFIVWDSLAICEYISGLYLGGLGWPSEQKNRSLARSVSSEMHSGFFALRSRLPMNCRLQTTIDIDESLSRDIQRVESIWYQYAAKDINGNLRLFGEFNIADCFYAPIAIRFRSYGVALNGLAADYQASLLEHPSILEWVEAAVAETEVVPENEI